MRPLYLVYQEHEGPWDWSKGLREQALFSEHAAFVDRLVNQKIIVLGGPLDEKEVLLVVDLGNNEGTIEEVRKQFTDDPWIKNGMLAIKAIRPWGVLLDGTIDTQ